MIWMYSTRKPHQKHNNSHPIDLKRRFFIAKKGWSEFLKNNFLKKACFIGHYEIVKMLLEANANVNQTDFAGQNALHYAVKGNLIFFRF